MRILWLNNRINHMKIRVNQTFTLPERFKGTILEKWTNYWRSLLSDYGEVVKDVGKSVREKPRRALLLSGAGYCIYEMAQRNPDEKAFYSILRYWNGQLIQVPKQLQNPVAQDYLRELELLINQQRLRFLSLGICTILWSDLYDRDDCTYPALCDYTRVRFWQIPERTLDIGFMGKYWVLNWKMQNFDINYL